MHEKGWKEPKRPEVKKAEIERLQQEQDKILKKNKEEEKKFKAEE